MCLTAQITTVNKRILAICLTDPVFLALRAILAA
jgi:hypothetical protein